ncbi:hypothetical protein [Boudabousia marimammalium]|uniref:Uncharacterized protein n=1 Tax=Boudabousia marimammalium TaxID=156892 RepID=A0A1Q5PM86_9ACTO|nr:hypothetical protein [Boudabousia marimammalium]OKL48647.1 hypothetical protein BM477_05445 [Boudabousia marimammalium]
MKTQTNPSSGLEPVEIPPTTLSYDPNFEFPAKFPSDPSTATQTFLYHAAKPPKNRIVSVALGFAYVGAVVPFVALLSLILGLAGYFNWAGRQGVRRGEALGVIVVSGAFLALQLITGILLYSFSVLQI